MYISSGLESSCVNIMRGHARLKHRQHSRCWNSMCDPMRAPEAKVKMDKSPAWLKQKRCPRVKFQHKPALLRPSFMDTSATLRLSPGWREKQSSHFLKSTDPTPERLSHFGSGCALLQTQIAHYPLLRTAESGPGLVPTLRVHSSESRKARRLGPSHASYLEAGGKLSDC